MHESKTMYIIVPFFFVVLFSDAKVQSVVPTKIAGITNGFLLETENASECFAISRAAKWIEEIKKVTD